MINIQPVSDAYLCSNCGACAAVCSKDAITFAYSNLGRMYAKVNDNCIDCGLCSKVCPTLDRINLHDRYKNKFVGTVLSTKVGKSKNVSFFRNAQSGGAVATILDYLFANNKIDAAVVCRMDYGDTPVVHGVVITSAEELSACQKSCYTPVALLSALKESKKYESIAVVGLPCQIQGAVSLSENIKSFKNIKYKLGLICDRTLCAGIMPAMKSLAEMTGQIKIDWRRKDFTKDRIYYPYKSAPVVVYRNDGETKIMPNIYRFALKDMFTAPRCRVCYDKLNTHADIVLADPWGMSDINWNEGASLIITRTQVGEDLLSEISDRMELSDRPFEEVWIGQEMNYRTRQIQFYSKALNTFPQKVDSYIYGQGEGEVLKNEFGVAVKEYRELVSNEMLPCDEITHKARTKALMAERDMNRSSKLWYRCLSKLKRIIIR